MCGPFDQFVTFLYTRDAEASRRFYEEAMGLPLAFDQGSCRIYRIAGEAFLGLCTNREPEARDGVCVTFATDDVDGWHARLTAAGIAPEEPPIFNERFNIYHFFLRDPDGHRLEVQEFRAPGWPRPRHKLASDGTGRP